MAILEKEQIAKFAESIPALRPLVQHGERVEAERIDDVLQGQLAQDLTQYPTKSIVIGYVLVVCMGIFGVHRFYLERPTSGAIMLLTFGGGVVWWLLDMVFFHAIIRRYNNDQIKRREEGRPPRGYDFVPDLKADLEIKPAWVKQRGAFITRFGFMLDVLAVMILASAVAAISVDEQLYEPLASAVIVTLVFMFRRYFVRFFHLPFIHQILHLDYRLRLYYSFNKPGNGLFQLFRPMVGWLFAPFVKSVRTELRLYLELGSIFAIPFLILETIQWLAAGAQMGFSLEDYFGRIVLMYFIIYAFTCPLGAILIKQSFLGHSAIKTTILGATALFFITLVFLSA